MSQSFFGTVQGWVKGELGPDFGGRFMAAILTQVAEFDPKPFRAFFAEVTKVAGFRKKAIRIEMEVPFKVRNGMRRVDLVVYLDDEPKLLIELKYRDQLQKSDGVRAAQLADYLYLCKKHSSKPKFLLLYRESQKIEDVLAIRRAGQAARHYSALAPYFARSAHPATRMLLQYFKEQGMTMQRIDTDHLYRFFHRLLLPWGGSGRVNKTSEIGEGPTQFQHLLNNMRLVSAEITPRVRAAARVPGMRAATVDFAVSNSYSVKYVRDAATGVRSKSLSMDNLERRGGTVDVWAQNALSSRYPWYYLLYGLNFVIEKGRPMRAELYVGYDSPEIKKASKGDFFDSRFSTFGALPLSMLRTDSHDELVRAFVHWIRRSARLTLDSGVMSEGSRRSMFKRLSEI